jgi:hypothetical protein
MGRVRKKKRWRKELTVWYHPIKTCRSELRLVYIVRLD